MLKSENQQWIERELEQSLRRVAAPGELWERIQGAGKPRSWIRSRFVAWASVPVLMVAAFFGSHTRNNSGLQFRSSDPTEVRAWVKASTGLDVPLHTGNLAGANRISAHAAEISYRAGGREMSLIVSSAPAQVRRTGKSVAWTADGQTYLLACNAPQDMRACILCHVGG
ncbi:MAG TPA: hypothetical protein VKX49_18975 [Bryobacteraceae bacterium]|nr:hypothetical protein [Bryobacteraceae bacterium]